MDWIWLSVLCKVAQRSRVSNRGVTFNSVMYGWILPTVAISFNKSTTLLWVFPHASYSILYMEANIWPKRTRKQKPMKSTSVRSTNSMINHGLIWRSRQVDNYDQGFMWATVMLCFMCTLIFTKSFYCAQLHEHCVIIHRESYRRYFHDRMNNWQIKLFLSPISCNS